MVTGSDHRLRLHWLREPGLGIIQVDALPEVAANTESLAGRIAEAIDIPLERARELSEKVVACFPEALLRRAEAHRTPAERNGVVLTVQFPALARKFWKDRVELVGCFQVDVDDEGRIVVENGPEPRIDTCVRMALAAGLPSAITDFDLTFTDSRTLSPCQTRLGLPPLLTRYGFRTEDAECVERHSGDGPLKASLTVSLAGECAAAWLSAPDERSPDFFATYARVSKAVQGALRRWVPYLFFREMEMYGDSEFGFPLAVYQALRPYRGRPRSSFTFDVLNTELVALAYRLAMRDIDPVAERIECVLSATGLHRIARHYEADRLKTLINYVKKQRRSMNSLLVGDTVLVEAFVRLGLDAHQAGKLVRGDARQAAKAISTARDTFVKSCHIRLKRHYAGADFQSLLPKLLIEATRALRPEFPMRATLRIQKESGASHVFVNV